jgi:hypothetical protein
MTNEIPDQISWVPAAISAVIVLLLSLLGRIFAIKRSRKRRQLEELLSRHEALSEGLGMLRNELEVVRCENRSMLVFLSESDALSEEPFKRVLPAELYTTTEDPTVTAAVEFAARETAAAVGFDIFFAGAARKGSWIKSLIFRARDELSKQEVKERVEKIERALELKHIDSIQSRVDLELSKAVLNLKKALDNATEGIVSIGSLFIIKTTAADGTAKIAIVSLSQEQMKLVRSNPQMQIDPAIFRDLIGGSIHLPGQQMSSGVPDGVLDIPMAHVGPKQKELDVLSLPKTGNGRRRRDGAGRRSTVDDVE